MEGFLASLEELESCAAIIAALTQFVRAFGMDCVAIGELPSEGVTSEHIRALDLIHDFGWT